MIKKPAAFALLKYIFAAALILWLVRGDHLNFEQIKPIFEPKHLSLIASLILLSVFMASERLRLLLKAQDVSISSAASLRLTLTGAFFNYVIPGSVGGDLVKAVYLNKDHGRTAGTSPYTVLFDRFIGLYALALIAAAAIIADIKRFVSDSRLMPLTLFTAAVLAILTSIPLIAVSPWAKTLYKKISDANPSRFVNVLDNIAKSVLLYRVHPVRVLKCLALSVICHLLTIVALIVAGSAAGYGEVPAFVYFIVAPIGLIVSAIPVAPGGIGIGQAAFFFLFNLYLGHSSPIGPAVVTSYQAIAFLISLSGLFFYLRR